MKKAKKPQEQPQQQSLLLPTIGVTTSKNTQLQTTTSSEESLQEWHKKTDLAFITSTTVDSTDIYQLYVKDSNPQNFAVFVKIFSDGTYTLNIGIHGVSTGGEQNIAAVAAAMEKLNDQYPQLLSNAQEFTIGGDWNIPVVAAQSRLTTDPNVESKMQQNRQKIAEGMQVVLAKSGVKGFQGECYWPQSIVSKQRAEDPFTNQQFYKKSSHSNQSDVMGAIVFRKNIKNPQGDITVVPNSTSSILVPKAKIATFEMGANLGSNTADLDNSKLVSIDHYPVMAHTGSGLVIWANALPPDGKKGIMAPKVAFTPDEIKRYSAQLANSLNKHLLEAINKFSQDPKYTGVIKFEKTKKSTELTTDSEEIKSFKGSWSKEITDEQIEKTKEILKEDLLKYFEKMLKDSDIKLILEVCTPESAKPIDYQQLKTTLATKALKTMKIDNPTSFVIDACYLTRDFLELLQQQTCSGFIPSDELTTKMIESNGDPIKLQELKAILSQKQQEDIMKLLRLNPESLKSADQLIVESLSHPKIDGTPYYPLQPLIENDKKLNEILQEKSNNDPSNLLSLLPSKEDPFSRLPLSSLFGYHRFQPSPDDDMSSLDRVVTPRPEQILSGATDKFRVLEKPTPRTYEQYVLDLPLKITNQIGSKPSKTPTTSSQSSISETPTTSSKSSILPTIKKCGK